MSEKKEIEYTDEQQRIINVALQPSSATLIVNALAGTGKTTTCFAVMRELLRGANKKILYLVFNKSMQLEAERRANSMKLDNVEIKTMHALAYKSLVRTGFFKDKNISNVRVKDIANTLYTDYTRAYFLLKIFNELLYSEYFFERDEIERFLKQLSRSVFYKEVIESYYIEVDDLLHIHELIQNSHLCTHDFYLKKFIEYLRDRKIKRENYDVVMLDEAQDANPSFLQLLKYLSPNMLILVGDKHQNIYSFRSTVNLMMSTNFFTNAKVMYLTKTFRFDNDIANLANKILMFKNEKHLIKSDKRITAVKNKAIISRTNSAMLEYYINMPQHIKKCVVFERGIEEVVKLALTIAFLVEKINPHEYLSQHDLSTKLIDEGFYRLFSNSFDDVEKELELYVDRMKNVKSEGEVAMEGDIVTALKLVKKHKAHGLVKIVRDYYSFAQNQSNENDKIYLSTAHSCKGQEYKNVTLLDDFRLFSDEECFNLLKSERQTEVEEALLKKLSRNHGELNLLYVALTRASEMVSLSLPVRNILDVIEYYAFKKQPNHSRNTSLAPTKPAEMLSVVEKLEKIKQGGKI